MPTVITGTDGINQVQAGAVESGDLPAGSVIQVVSSASNKILVMHTAGGFAFESPESIRFLLKRNGTQVWNAHRYGYQEAGTGVWASVPFNVSYLDSPNTTLSVSYEFSLQTELVAFVRHNSNTGVFSGSSTAITIAMEIAG
jgi:hypothetical protein